MDSIYNVFDAAWAILLAGGFATLALTHREMRAARIALIAGSIFLILRWTMWALVTDMPWWARSMAGAVIGGLIFGGLQPTLSWAQHKITEGQPAEKNDIAQNKMANRDSIQGGGGGRLGQGGDGGNTGANGEAGGGGGAALGAGGGGGGGSGAVRLPDGTFIAPGAGGDGGGVNADGSAQGGRGGQTGPVVAQNRIGPIIGNQGIVTFGQTGGSNTVNVDTRPPRLAYSEAMVNEIAQALPKGKAITLLTVGDDEDQKVAIQFRRSLESRGVTFAEHDAAVMYIPEPKNYYDIQSTPDGVKLIIAPSIK